MIFTVLFFIIVLVRLILSFIESKYKLNNKTKKLWISMICFYFIMYSLLITVVYFITDTITDFFIVTFCFYTINLMYMTIFRRWFHTKLAFRLILITIVPIISLFILLNISRFMLINNIFQLYTLLILISTTEFRPKGKYENLEFKFYVLSIIIVGIVFRGDYLIKIYNKPQICTLNKMINELEIDNNDTLAIYGTGGLRGELIEVTFHTTSNYYKVYYRYGNIIKYELIR